VTWVLIGIGWLFPLGLILHDAMRHEERDERGADHNHGDTPSTIAASESDEQQKHRAAEREHWDHERRHSRKVRIFTAVAAGAAVVAAVVAYGAYRETRRQADAAVDQLAIQSSDQRPWLHLEDAKTEPINYTANGLNFTMRFSVKNYGRSPATHAYVRAVVIPRKLDALAEERTLCETYDFLNKSGPLVFTGTPQEFPITLTFYKDDIDRQREYFKAQGSNTFPVWMTVVACVQYDSLYDAKPHHEGHVYNLVPVDVTNAAVGSVLSAPNGNPSFLTPSIID
jgi:hypothetical protein